MLSCSHVRFEENKVGIGLIHFEPQLLATYQGGFSSLEKVRFAVCCSRLPGGMWLLACWDR